jgi:hypothetical protein
MAVLSGTTYKELVRELGRNTPITANGLMDIITNFVTGEEAVGAIFGGDQDKGKHKVDGPASSSRPWPTTLSLLLIARNPEGPPAGASLTKC